MDSPEILCPFPGLRERGRARGPWYGARRKGRAEATLVVGLGIDLIELDRVRDALARWGPRFVQKLMDPQEAGRLPPGEPGRSRAIALAIAGKEAASKAIGTGWTRGVRWRDVEVFLEEPPRVVLHAEALARARRLGSPGSTRTQLEIREGLVLGEVWLLG